jgi:hypothetical protein
MRDLNNIWLRDADRLLANNFHMSGPTANKDNQEIERPGRANQSSSNPGRDRNQAEGLTFGITSVSDPSLTGCSSFGTAGFQAAIGGAARGRIGVASADGTDLFSARIQGYNGSSQTYLGNLLSSIAGTGCASASYNAATNTAAGTLKFSDGSNNLSADVVGSDAQIVFEGQAVRDWSEAYLKKGAGISQITARWQGGQISISPMVGAQLSSGLRVTNSVSMNDLFDAIMNRESVYRHSLSGTRADSTSGYGIGDKKLLFNQYNLANQPGASILSFDLFNKDSRGDGVTILIGTHPDVGSFIGGWVKYERSFLRGVEVNPEQLAAQSEKDKSQSYHIYAQGDLLFVRAPDGTQRIVGELSFERANADSAAALKVNIHKNLGMPDEVNTGFDTPVNFSFEYRW